MPTFQCPACKALIQLQMKQPQPVQDVIVQWCPNAFKDDRPNVASVTEDNTLILGLTNQEGKRVFINVKLGVPMPQLVGAPKPFQLVEIFPGVLKLTPSVFDPALHAYVTIVGAPIDGE